jgi:hypothetical protein
MDTAILYAIWLNNETTMCSGAYKLLETDQLYWCDSKTDNEALYNIFLNSDYYKNSIEIEVEEPYTLKRGMICVYDNTITKPPFRLIPLVDVEVKQPDNDYLGEKFAEILRITCKQKGYVFKCYSINTEFKGFDFSIIVY